MFDELFRSRSLVQCHLRSPLLRQRLEYLQQCAKEGYRPVTLHQVAADLLQIQNLFSLATSSNLFSVADILAAVKRWGNHRPRHFNYKNGRRSRERIGRHAVRWLRFLGRLRLPHNAPLAYRSLLESFLDPTCGSKRGSRRQAFKLDIGMSKIFCGGSFAIITLSAR
jgi:hypothetical protein